MRLFDFLVAGSVPLRTDRHRLAGTVFVDGQPASRLIGVFDRSTLVLLAAIWSDPTTGAWEVYGLPEYPAQSLLVLALDTTGAYNAEMADFVSQVATAPAP